MFFGAECSVKLEAQYDDLAKYPSQNLVALTADSDSDKINVPGNPSGTISLTADKVGNTNQATPLNTHSQSKTPVRVILRMFFSKEPLIIAMLK